MSITLLFNAPVKLASCLGREGNPVAPTHWIPACAGKTETGVFKAVYAAVTTGSAGE